jgi:hypothetical protein
MTSPGSQCFPVARAKLPAITCPIVLSSLRIVKGRYVGRDQTGRRILTVVDARRCHRVALGARSLSNFVELCRALSLYTSI